MHRTLVRRNHQNSILKNVKKERTNKYLIKRLEVETDFVGIIRDDLAMDENISKRIYRKNRNNENKYKVRNHRAVV